MKELYERTPFREPLRKMHPNSARQIFVAEDGGYVVRPEIWGSAPPVDDLKIARYLHAELEMNYGIAVPRYDIVLGPTPIEGTNAAYLVVDKIEGTELINAWIDDGIIRTFVYSLLEYHIDKYQNGGFSLNDIGINQYVYGVAPGQSEKRIYLVDIDPFYGYVDNINPQERRDNYFSGLEDFNELVDILERSKGVNLSDLRQRFEQFLRETKPKAHPSDQKTINRIFKSIINRKPA